MSILKPILPNFYIPNPKFTPDIDDNDPKTFLYQNIFSYAKEWWKQGAQNLWLGWSMDEFLANNLVVYVEKEINSLLNDSIITSLTVFTSNYDWTNIF